MTGWRISPLPDARLAEAWPLVHLRYPTWTLDTWLCEARTLLADRLSGLSVAQTASRYIYAVCGFAVDTSDPGRPLLRLPLVANLLWRGGDDPLGRLLANVEAAGCEYRCHEVRVDSAAIAAAGDGARWQRLGYERDGVALRKGLLSHPASTFASGLEGAACP